MNTLEIDYCLRNNAFTRKSFVGVYPSDLLPNKVSDKKQSFIVANFSPSTSRGTHWVCFTISPNELEFFDSSGGTLLVSRDFQRFVERNQRKYMRYNSNRLQSSETSCCGEFVCAFLDHRARGQSFNSFLNLFDDNYKNNDEKIMQMFLNRFPFQSI